MSADFQLRVIPSVQVTYNLQGPHNLTYCPTLAVRVVAEEQDILLCRTVANTVPDQQPTRKSTVHKLQSTAHQGRRLTFTVGYSNLNRESSSGCISMFSVNLTFDKTLITQFCYLFSAKIATFWAINV